MEKNGKHNGEPDNILSKVLRIAAYPLGAFSGWWVTRNQIRHYTFDKLSKMGGLTDVRAEYENKIREVTLAGVNQVGEAGGSYDLKKATATIEREYTDAIRERMKNLKVNTLARQSEYIYKPQFHKALIEGFTAATIAMGALLIVANNKSLAKMFNDISDKDSEEKPTQQRS